jgi:large subunit ribosomal protein L21
MYAIVDIAGQQFKVEKNQKIFVHRLNEKEGSKVDFDRVLLIDNDKKVLIGEPVIQGAVISAKILSHPKGDKVMVFKKKRRKGYQVKNGHRQYLTEILIEDIIEKAAAKKAPAKKTQTKPAAKEKTASEKKPASAKKPAATKPTTGAAAAKKPTAKKTAATGTAAKKTTTGTAAKKTTAKNPETKKDNK